MSSSFNITCATIDTLKLDAKRRAQAVFTVTNNAPRSMRGLARAKALGDTKQQWLRIEGEAERDFGRGTTQQFTVTFDGAPAVSQLPGTTTPAASETEANSKQAARRYPFRLDVAAAVNPEEDFTEGPTVTVDVVAAESVTPRKFPFWIIPVIAVLLIGIAIASWLLLRTKKVEVPNVVDKPIAEATSILKEHKLEASIKETKVTGRVSAGRVASQEPEASQKVPEGSAVELVVEAAPTGPIVLINFADGAPSASWTNDSGGTMTLTPSHDGLPQGSVVKRDNEVLENGTAATKVIETHPRWADGGNITGTFNLPQPLSAGDKFRTQIGFLQGAAPGRPSVRVRLLFNGSVIDEISKSYDGSLRNWTVPLDDYVGHSGTFSLQVVGIPTANWAWLCWINPRIER
jgi:PASTA domain